MPDDDGITVDYELTLEDWHDVAWTLSEPSLRVPRWTMTALLSGFGIAGAALTLSLAPLLAAAFLLWCLGWAALMHRFAWRRSVRRRVELGFQEYGSLGILGNHRIVIDHRGIRESTSVGEWFQDWRAVGRIDATERFVLVYLPGGLVHVVPRGAFASGDAAEAFVARARAWRAQAALPRPEPV